MTSGPALPMNGLSTSSPLLDEGLGELFLDQVLSLSAGVCLRRLRRILKMKPFPTVGYVGKQGFAQKVVVLPAEGA